VRKEDDDRFFAHGEIDEAYLSQARAHVPRKIQNTEKQNMFDTDWRNCLTKRKKEELKMDEEFTKRLAEAQKQADECGFIEGEHTEEFVLHVNGTVYHKDQVDKEAKRNGWLSDDKRWKIYRHLKRLETETPNASLEEKTNSINGLFDMLAGKKLAQISKDEDGDQVMKIAECEKWKEWKQDPEGSQVPWGKKFQESLARTIEKAKKEKETADWAEELSDLLCKIGSISHEAHEKLIKNTPKQKSEPTEDVQTVMDWIKSLGIKTESPSLRDVASFIAITSDLAKLDLPNKIRNRKSICSEKRWENDKAEGVQSLKEELNYPLMDPPIEDWQRMDFKYGAD